MKFTDWLDGERGRLSAVASHFGITQGAVSQWRTDGVPPARMKSVRDFTGGAVTLEEMLPEPELTGTEGAPPVAFEVGEVGHG